MNPARVLGPAVASNFFGTVDKAGKIHAVSIIYLGTLRRLPQNFTTMQ